MRVWHVLRGWIGPLPHAATSERVAMVRVAAVAMADIVVAVQIGECAALMRRPRVRDLAGRALTPRHRRPEGGDG